MNDINDDYDSNKPEEAGSTYEDFAIPEDLCPECKKPLIVERVSKDDHIIHHEAYCPDCGYLETD